MGVGVGDRGVVDGRKCWMVVEMVPHGSTAPPRLRPRPRSPFPFLPSLPSLPRAPGSGRQRLGSQKPIPLSPSRICGDKYKYIYLYNKQTEKEKEKKKKKKKKEGPDSRSDWGRGEDGILPSASKITFAWLSIVFIRTSDTEDISNIE